MSIRHAGGVVGGLGKGAGGHVYLVVFRQQQGYGGLLSADRQG